MRILDLFCGAGGAAMGLHRHFPGAEIVGVDLAPQPRYPFIFEQADAMTYPLAGFDFIWASPPCQGYSVMRHLPWNKDKDYPMLIEPTRDRLRSQGAPWIIENVMGAQRKAKMGANWLCGTMFGKRFYRHRVFESSFAWFMPLHEKHRDVIRGSRLISGRARTIMFSDTEDNHHNVGSGLTLLADEPRSGIYEDKMRDHGLLRQPNVPYGVPRVIETAGRAVREANDARRGIDAWRQSHEERGWAITMGNQPGAMLARQEMDTEWMNAHETSQAVPPCYSEYLAKFIPVAE